MTTSGYRIPDTVGPTEDFQAIRDLFPSDAELAKREKDKGSALPAIDAQLVPPRSWRLSSDKLHDRQSFIGPDEAAHDDTDQAGAAEEGAMTPAEQVLQRAVLNSVDSADNEQLDSHTFALPIPPDSWTLTCDVGTLVLSGLDPSIEKRFTDIYERIEQVVYTAKKSKRAWYWVQEEKDKWDLVYAPKRHLLGRRYLRLDVGSDDEDDEPDEPNDDEAAEGPADDFADETSDESGEADDDDDDDDSDAQTNA